MMRRSGSGELRRQRSIRPRQNLLEIRKKLLPPEPGAVEGLLLIRPEARLLHAQSRPRARRRESPGNDALETIGRPGIGQRLARLDHQNLAVEPNKTLSYTWGAFGLKSVVIWTLTPTSTGTHLRMEQSGFRPDQQQAYQGAKGGWARFFANMEQVLARIE